MFCHIPRSVADQKEAPAGRSGMPFSALMTSHLAGFLCHCRMMLELSQEGKLAFVLQPHLAEEKPPVGGVCG